MKRIKALNLYQKGVLLLLAVMVLVFTAAYLITTAQEGFAYQKAILVPSEENGRVVYSGKIQGKQARFTVSSDHTVEFRYGEKTYGPYTIREDPTAIPQEEELRQDMTGIELRRGEKVIFRGGVLLFADKWWLYNEDGSLDVSSFYTMSNGILKDENGRVIDSIEPTATTILELMAGPKLTHKGDMTIWAIGMVLCIVTAILILFADELFYWNLGFQIRDADEAEPSDLVIACRYISWTVFPIIAMILFILGLLWPKS